MHRQELLLLSLGWGVVLLDCATRGLDGDVSGRFLGFVDSLAHCASWVAVPGLPQDIGFWSRFFGSILTKHGSSLLTSSFLRTTPPLFMGWEYNFPFLVALVVAHWFRFVPRVVRTRHGPWRALFVVSGALYKLRKMHFAVRRAESALQAEFLGVLTMELTGWLAIVARGLARGKSANQILEAFAQPRFFISLVVSYLVYAGSGSVLVLLLLMLHKYLAPFNVETSVLDPFDESDVSMNPHSPLLQSSKSLSQ